MRSNRFFALVITGWVLTPEAASACAACYGQSDSPLAQGMNWGILSLLGVIVTVLLAVAGFFVYLARRAALFPLMAQAQPNPASSSASTS